MKRIPLSKGRVALVDDEDYNKINKYKWNASKGANGKYYVVRNGPKLKNVRPKIYIHSIIVNNLGGLEIDHRNGNPLDNRRQNLRICTRSQNQFNKGKQKNNTSGFKGVSKEPVKRKWRAQIRLSRMLTHLGYFSTKEEAACAYNWAAAVLFGEFAKLNKINLPEVA